MSILNLSIHYRRERILMYQTVQFIRKKIRKNIRLIVVNFVDLSFWCLSASFIVIRRQYTTRTLQIIVVQMKFEMNEENFHQIRLLSIRFLCPCPQFSCKQNGDRTVYRLSVCVCVSKMVNKIDAVCSQLLSIYLLYLCVI